MHCRNFWYVSHTCLTNIFSTSMCCLFTLWKCILIHKSSQLRWRPHFLFFSQLLATFLMLYQEITAKSNDRKVSTQVFFCGFYNLDLVSRSFIYFSKLVRHWKQHNAFFFPSPCPSPTLGFILLSVCIFLLFLFLMLSLLFFFHSWFSACRYPVSPKAFIDKSILSSLNNKMVCLLKTMHIFVIIKAVSVI